MNFLFVHNNFPAQYKHVAQLLAANPANMVAAIGSSTARDVPGVDLRRYSLPADPPIMTHAFARRFDIECRRAEQVLYAAAELQASGFRPHTIVVHSGWGENLPLRAVFPDARIINYCEFYYRSDGQDVNFDPEFPRLTLDGTVGLSIKNAASLLGLIDCDVGLSPTHWQRSTFPPVFQSKIQVVHEGVDTNDLRPDPDAVFDLPAGGRVRAGEEVVTFVSRNLEPLRGYHCFMRALPQVLEQRPKAQVLIVGGEGASYGAPPAPGQTWKQVYLDEVRPGLDLSRVHFLGQIDYARFRTLLRVSAAHVYLTYPFVLSWSFLEAMSTECLVIGADVEPITEVVDGANGLLVPFFDVAVLAKTIVEALAHPQRYAAMRKNARATILSRFDAHRICIPAALRLLHEDR